LKQSDSLTEDNEASLLLDKLDLYMSFFFDEITAGDGNEPYQIDDRYGG